MLAPLLRNDRSLSDMEVSCAEVPRTVEDVLTIACGRHEPLCSLPYHRSLVLLCSLCYAYGPLNLLLPIYLLPRIESQWSLAPWQRALVMSATFAAMGVGIVLLGLLADLAGRRRILMWALSLGFLASLLTFACSSFVPLVATRVVAGFCTGGAMNLAFVLGLELCTPRHRLLFKGCMELAGWGGGALWLCLVAFLVRTMPWQALALSLALPAAAVALAVAYMPESPRWLLNRGETEAALTVLQRVARGNGQALPSDTTLATPKAALATNAYGPPHTGISTTHAPRRPRWIRLCCELCHPRVRRSTLLVGISWFGSASAYFAVVLWPVPLGGDDDGVGLFMRQALGALIELPAYAAMAPLGERLGRPRTWALFLFLLAASLLALAWIGEGGGATTGALILLARFGGGGATTIAWVAGAEAFPTSCRGLGVGYGAACSRLGSTLAPVLVSLLARPSLWFGGLGLLSCVSVLALRDQTGGAIAEHADDSGGAQACSIRCSSGTRTHAPPPAHDRGVAAGETRVGLGEQDESQVEHGSMATTLLRGGQPGSCDMSYVSGHTPPRTRPQT